jgi:tripartite-type tricarboxylate transporter receptor subunit TctC
MAAIVPSAGEKNHRRYPCAQQALQARRDVNMKRRRFLQLAAGVAAPSAVPGIARAQSYPTRPVHIIVGFGAGSGLDLYARLISQWLSDRLGQSFIIENRLGAGSNTATEAVVHAPADGYTLLMASAAVFTNASLYSNLGFDFMHDIAPVGSVARTAFAIVANPEFPAKTLPELIAYAKVKPGKITVGSAGVGTLTHVAGVLFNMMSGTTMVHVPYRGEPAALADLMGGQIQLDFCSLPAASEFIKSGKLQAIAVTTAQRSDMFPDIPAVSELLPGYDASGWSGIGAPKATPAQIIDRLNKEINAGLRDAKLRAQFVALGSETVPSTPAQYERVIATETEKWGKVIRQANIKVE